MFAEKHRGGAAISKIDKQFLDLASACRHFFKSNRRERPEAYKASPMFRQLSDILAGMLSGLSAYQQGPYPGWKPDSDHPGYLIRIEPPLLARAPFHIVPVFPSEVELNGIWHLSRAVKTIDDSAICLSGSTALLKASATIGDLDFCEYVRGEPSEIAASLVKRTASSSDLLFRELSFGGHHWTRSDDLPDIASTLLAIDPGAIEFSYAKIDYVAKADGFRPIEVSNVLIFCDSSWKSKSLARSFAAQEAMLDASIAVPNDLSDPFEIGRYIEWLLEQAVEYMIAGTPTKCLKRCLSLSRICFHFDLTDKIRSAIERSPAYSIEEAASVDELIGILKATGDTKRAAWLVELEELRMAIKLPPEADREQIRHRLDMICREVLHELCQILDARPDLEAGTS